ncbi:MAG: hypothetical protein ACI4MG_08565 [Aristaeellaceae bacterium]
MSNEVKKAIDTGLQGLRVTQRDVDTILRRARTETASPRRSRASWGPVAAIAAVLAVLLLGAGAKLLRGTRDVTPLSTPNTQETFVPGREKTFRPVGTATAAPPVGIGTNEAIALAEAHIHQEHDAGAELRNSALYAVACTERLLDSWCYEVDFRPLDEFGTAYTVRLRMADGTVVDCDVQRGAGTGHTAQEIYAGYARIYGAERRMWTQSQLRTYTAMLGKAASGSLRWTDYLYLQNSYPDVAEGAMTKEALLATMDPEGIAKAYDLQQGVSWASVTQEGELRARYISAYPNPVWKVAADQRVINKDGYELARTLLVEIDSVSGSVLDVQAVDTLEAERYESFLHATVDALMSMSVDSRNPDLTDAEGDAIAAAWAAQTWGETRELTDEGCFVRTEEADPYGALYQGWKLLTYRSTGEGERTQYTLLIDWYGDVIAANGGTAPEDGEIFAPIAPQLDWNRETLQAYQALARRSAQAEDPIVQAFVRTEYVNDHQGGIPASIDSAVAAALGIRATTRCYGVVIGTDSGNVWKVAVESDQGNFLVEVSEATGEVISVMRVRSLIDSWYLPFVLTADLQAAGVALTWDAQDAPAADAAEHGGCAGMRIDHLYQRFKQLYGCDMSAWSQEQLRAFREMAILSDDYDYDLGVAVLRSTVYPDIPENAISRERAAERAAEAIGLTEGWVSRGAVLIGTAADSITLGTPVWKVCLYGSRSGSTAGSFWYAEVNCMTGTVQSVYQDADGVAFPGASYDDGTPQNLWFRDIVLEQTIRDCEANWVNRGHG